MLLTCPVIIIILQQRGATHDPVIISRSVVFPNFQLQGVSRRWVTSHDTSSQPLAVKATLGLPRTGSSSSPASTILPNGVGTPDTLISSKPRPMMPSNFPMMNARPSPFASFTCDPGNGFAPRAV